MPASTHWNIRKTPRRKAQIAEIARRIKIKEDNFTAIIDFALCFSIWIGDAISLSDLINIIKGNPKLIERLKEIM